MVALSAGCGSGRLSSIVAPSSRASTSSVGWTEHFEQLDRQRWREVVFTGHTQYEAVTLDGRRCLKASSHHSASLLVSRARFNPHREPWLSWDWRVDHFVEREALARKEGSDAAARVYVYFNTWGLPWQKHSLAYVWSSTLPVGTIVTSPFASTTKMLVVEQGPQALGQWRRERRNLVDDYMRAFHTSPPAVLAIGLMSDSDNTHSESLAYFDELRVSHDEAVPDSSF